MVSSMAGPEQPPGSRYTLVFLLSLLSLGVVIEETMELRGGWAPKPPVHLSRDVLAAETSAPQVASIRGLVPAITPGHTAGASRTVVHTEPSGLKLSPVVPDGIPVVALVLCTWSANKDHVDTEAKGAIFSIAKSEPGRIHFAIVTEVEHTEDIAGWFAWCHPGRITFEVVPVTQDFVVKAIDALGIKGTPAYHHHGGFGAAAKVFLPTLLKHHKRALFVDTDVIVARPISELFREFDHFKSDSLFGITNISSRQAGAEAQAEDKDQYRMCSCIMLLDLEKMRKVGWEAHNPWLRKQFAGTDIHHKYAEYSDQALYRQIRRLHPFQVHLLPRTWMLSRCQKYVKLRILVRGFSWASVTPACHASPPRPSLATC